MRFIFSFSVLFSSAAIAQLDGPANHGMGSEAGNKWLRENECKSAIVNSYNIAFPTQTVSEAQTKTKEAQAHLMDLMAQHPNIKTDRKLSENGKFVVRECMNQADPIEKASANLAIALGRSIYDLAPRKADPMVPGTGGSGYSPAPTTIDEH